MGVADLLAAGAQLLARRLMGATHQPGVRQELPDALEAIDLVHFIQEHQRQDRPDAGNGPQPMIRLHVVHLGGSRQVQFRLADQFVELGDEFEIEVALICTEGSVKRCGMSRAARLAA